MAYGEKYYLPFVNVQGHECVVRFLFEGWDNESYELTGGARPFTISEFNNDEDIFKPLRPQQATIEIIARAGIVSMDDFLSDNDTDILVRFDLDQWQGYWSGYLTQEDIQETWIDTVHVLTLRATDGLGDLKNIPLTDTAGFELGGIYTPFQFIQYAADKAVLGFTNCVVFSNLFHTSMDDDVDQTGLDQCYIDARTFGIREGVDDCYTVLEKINKSWSQTLFQYNGKWWIYRVEELFQTPTLPLIGFVNSLTTRQPLSERHDIEVGATELVKPIAPEMLRFVQKPSKATKITYSWDDFDEIVCNEDFRVGDFFGTFPLIGGYIDIYTVTGWTLEKGTLASPTAVTDSRALRNVVFKGGKLEDEYILIPDYSEDTWLRSCKIKVNEGDQVNFTIQVKREDSVGAPYDAIVDVVHGYILLTGDDGGYYNMLKTSGAQVYDGSWFTDNSTWTASSGVTPKGIVMTFTDNEWQTYEVSIAPTPESGYIEIILYRDDPGNPSLQLDQYYKDLKIEISPSINLRRIRITSDYDKYTIQSNITKNFEDEIYMDDAESKNHKGAIFELDGETLTGDEWYRRRLSSERFTFKRHVALARWFMNRSYKTKLDCNFFGITYDKEGTEYPIGLMNTISFVDDAPTKLFAISNLKEIDFMSCQWKASLIEVYDTDIPDDVPGDTDVHTYEYVYES